MMKKKQEIIYCLKNIKIFKKLNQQEDQRMMKINMNKRKILAKNNQKLKERN